MTFSVCQVPCEEDCTLCDDPALLNALELGLPYEPLTETLDSLVSCQLNKLTRLAETPGELDSLISVS